MKYLFSVLFSIAIGTSAQAEVFHDSDFVFGPSRYACPSGEKTFDTVVAPACDDGNQGSREQFKSCDNGLVARLRIGKDLLKPKISLNVGNVEIVTGDGAVEFLESRLTPKQILALNEEAKKAPGHDGVVFIPAKISVTSGPCHHELDMTIRQYKDVIEALAAGLQDQADKAKLEKQCASELSDPKLSVAYANAELCLLKKCDEESKKKMAQERQAGERSGFVNKILLANLGHYQQQSLRYQEMTKSYIKEKGQAVACNTKLTDEDYALDVSGSINAFACYGGIPVSSFPKSACFLANAKALERISKTDKIKVMPMVGTSERSVKNEFNFNDEKIIKRAAFRLYQDQLATKPTSPTVDPNAALEPDQQVAALHKTTEDHRNAPWKFMGGPYACSNIVGIIWVKQPAPMQMTKDFNPARIGNLVVSSHALEAGLLPGDIVLSIKGVPPTQPTPKIGKDEVVAVEYSRDGEKHTAQVKAIESCPE